MNYLEQELKTLAAGNAYPFHMPGHKRMIQEAAEPASCFDDARGFCELQECNDARDLCELQERNAAARFCDQKRSSAKHDDSDPLRAIRAYDITEIDGFDNLHDPQDLLKEEMEAAAAFYGTQETYFLVNGSTCGILAALSAAVPKGGRILMERSAHISVYHAAYLRELRTEYFTDPVPPRSEKLSAGRQFEEAAEDRIPEATKHLFDAIVITSPTYEGVVKDVRAWADYAHAQGAILIVDEAHGAHFSMHPYFPESAVRCGADLVIQSLHKTLPALTSTALLHNVTGRVPDQKLGKFLKIYETSSPSYILLASITSLMHALYRRGRPLQFPVGRGPEGEKEVGLIQERQKAERIEAETDFDTYADCLTSLRKELSALKHLHLAGGANSILTFDSELPGGKCGMQVDPGKIVILTEDGSSLYDLLRTRYHLQPEMKAPGYVLLMTSPADTEEGFARLKQALFEIDADLQNQAAASAGPLPIPPQLLSISDAYDADAEEAAFADAVGRAAADFVIVYPPDAPLLVPGEIISGEIVEAIRTLKAQGLTLTGCAGGRLKVAAQNIAAQSVAAQIGKRE